MRSLAKYYIERIKYEYDTWYNVNRGKGIPGRLLLRAFEPKIVSAIIDELKKENLNFTDVGSNDGFILAIEDHERYVSIQEKKYSFSDLTKERNREGDFFCLMLVAETKPTHDQLMRIDQDFILEPDQTLVWVKNARQISSNPHAFSKHHEELLAKFVSDLTDVKWTNKPFVELDKIALFIENVIESTISDGLFWDALGKNLIYLGGINRLDVFSSLEKSSYKYKEDFRKIISKTLIEDIDFWNAYYKNNQVDLSEIRDNLKNIINKNPVEYTFFCEKLEDYFESFFSNDIEKYEKIKIEIQENFSCEYPFQEVLRQKKQQISQGLGERTKQFLSDEDTYITEDCITMLESLDSRSDKPNKTELRRFYFKYRDRLSKNTSLDDSWLKEISTGKQVECVDLIIGLHTVLSKYIYLLPVDNNKKITLTLAKERSKNLLVKKNKDALNFFFSEYNDLDQYWKSFGDNFFIDFPKHFNKEDLLLDERLKSGRVSSKNNELVFGVNISNKDNEKVVESWLITWKFNSDGFESVKYKDFNSVESGKGFFYNYSLSIDPMHIKNIGYTPSISNRNLFMPITVRESRGVLINKKKVEDDSFYNEIKKLLDHNFISESRYNFILEELKKVISSWKSAVKKVLLNPLTSNLDDFKLCYIDFINMLINESESNSNFQDLIYIFTKCHTLNVKEYDAYEVHLPWSPYSLILKSEKNKIFNCLASSYRNNNLTIANQDDGVFPKIIKDLEEGFGKNLIFKKSSQDNQVLDLVCSKVCFGYYEYSPLTNSKNSLENNEIKSVISNTIEKFIDVFPFQKNHLQIVIDGLVSYEQVLAVYDELLSYSENSDENLSIVSMFISEDRDFLDLIYQRLCDSFDQNKIDSSIALRVVSNLDEVFDSEIDILFSFDPLFKKNIISNNPLKYVVSNSKYSFWEYTTTRKIPSDPISKKSSFSLNNHISDSVGALFHQASMRSVAKDKVFSFCREVPQNSLESQVRKSLQKTNWLVIYDYLLNKDTLEFTSDSVLTSGKGLRRILRYVQGEGDKRSLGILTERDTAHLASNLSRNIKDWRLVSYGKEENLANIIFDRINSFSGDALLKSVGETSYSHDIVGTAGSSLLIEYLFKNNEKLLNIFWIHLDDYMRWFKSSIDDDALRSLGKTVGYLSDLLGIFLTKEDGEVTLNIIVCESKLTRGSLEQNVKSTKQLKSTFSLISSMLKSSKAFDFNYWLNKFFEFIIVNAKFSPAQFEFKDLLDLDKERIKINIYGISMIMHYDNSLVKTKIDNIYYDDSIPLYQLELSSHDTSLIFKYMLDQELSNLSFSDCFKITPLVLNQENLIDTDSFLESNFTIDDLSKVAIEQDNFELNDTVDLLSSRSNSLLSNDLTVLHNLHKKTSVDLLESCISFLKSKIVKEEIYVPDISSMKNGIREILSYSRFPSYFVDEVITCNSILIKIKGDVKINPVKIMAMKDTFLSVAGLHLRYVYPEAGVIVLVFDRDKREKVQFVELLEESLNDRFRTIGLGYNNKIILGKNEFENNICYFTLDGASPHALIGGQTKSGKSILMNNMIVDLIMTNTPDKLRLRLFDPKQVEFSSYANSAHLAHPVVLDKDTAITRLQEAEDLMNERYVLLKDSGLKDIEAFNIKYFDKPMSREVIFFDELADWILDDEFKKNAKDIIVRLSSKGRAAGIHLILATQRPSNDVVFPLLRANLDTKIALKVDRDLNSEIILGESGAENLLGYGHGIVKTEGESFNIQVGFTDSVVFEELVGFIIKYWNS